MNTQQHVNQIVTALKNNDADAFLASVAALPDGHTVMASCRHHDGNGNYNGDGEEAFDVASLSDISKTVLIDVYQDCGETNDVDLICDVWLDTPDDCIDLTRVEAVYDTNEAAQDACTVIAEQSEEYVTHYVGVNEDDEFVKWTNNGGTRGSHDRMCGDGVWRERYDAPETIDAEEFLKLAVEYGADPAVVSAAVADDC